MLYIREDLGSLEAARKYNRDLYNYRIGMVSKGWSAGCIGSLACEGCYHVIADSVCLCSCYFKCPKCGKENSQPNHFIPGWDYDSVRPDVASFLARRFPKVEKVVEDYSI